MSHQFETGFVVREKAWHGLATVLTAVPTVEEAIREAGLDWGVEEFPIFLADGSKCHEHKALVRSTDRRILNVVGKDYTPFQNEKAFAFFNPFLHEGDATLESAGSLKEGRFVWVLAKLESREVSDGDPVTSYLLIWNGHGGAAVAVQFTPIRVVCWNTLSAARTKGEKDIEGLKRYVREVFLPEEAKVLQEWDRVVATNRAVDGPVPEEPELKMPRNFERIEKLFESGPGHELAGSTVYGAYNAVTHWIDHERGRSEENRLKSTWLGDGKKIRDRAHTLALQTFPS